MVKIVSNVSPNSLLQSNGASPIKPSGVIAAADTITTGIWNAGSVTSSSFITAIGNLRGLALGINTAPQANAGTLQLLPTANGVDVIVANRATDSSPTGDFLNFLNTANNASLFKVDVTGAITTGTWSATKIGTVFGGTNADSSGSSGVISVNSGTWTFNNVLTTNRLLIAAASNTITSSTNLTYDGTSFKVGTTGTHSIGGAAVAGEQLRVYADVTADSAGSGAGVALRTGGGTMTAGANGDTFALNSSFPTTIAKGAFTGLIVTGYNLAGSHFSATGTGTVTDAATLKVLNAPTIGTNNYALWIAGGQARLGTDVRFGTRTALGAETVTGFITITDDGGTSRKLAVVS